ncbi:nucleotidyltransferase domain-containing protein [bacterium]|nr:nucleotidyltransferase domain-containing protein [bacterium]
MLSVEKIKDVVCPLAKKYGVERVYLFGSYARGEATEKSDVDLRIDRGAMRGFKCGGFYADVKEGLNCNLDILTTKQLRDDFLANIKKEEILLYDSVG